jgi:hypothetical protein
MAHVRGGRKRARRCYLTKKTFEGTTTLQMRWEIVNLYAYEGVRGWAELSRRFSALHPRSPRQSKTCHRVVNLWKATGDVWPRSSAGSGPRQGHRRFARHMTEDVMTFIQMHVRLHPAAYINRDLVPLLRELLDRPTLSEAAVYDAVRRLGITHKGIRRINSEKCPTKIGLFTERMAMHPHHRDTYCFDESGCDAHTLWRRFGWSEQGTRAEAVGDLRKGKRYSVLALTSCRGLVEIWIKRGGFKSHDVLEVTNEMAQILPAGSTVLCDNCIIHHSAAVWRSLATAGIAIEFTPPYCPEFQPTENFFSSMKADLRLNASYYRQLRQAYGDDGAMLGIRMAAIGVKQEHFPKWWRHCGMVID